MPRKNPQVFWSAERTAKLRDLWWDGKSAEAVTVLIGARDAKSVREKINRDGIKRAPGFVPTAIPPLLNKMMLKGSELPEFVTKPDEPKPVVRADGSIVMLVNARDGECRWMHGRPHAHARLCGHKVYRMSWCKHHFKRCFPASRVA